MHIGPKAIFHGLVIPLKVGSCPHDDNFVQTYFCPFILSKLIFVPFSVKYSNNFIF